MIFSLCYEYRTLVDFLVPSRSFSLLFWWRGLLFHNINNATRAKTFIYTTGASPAGLNRSGGDFNSAELHYYIESSGDILILPQALYQHRRDESASGPLTDLRPFATKTPAMEEPTDDGIRELMYQLESATVKCSERCLYQSAKWYG